MSKDDPVAAELIRVKCPCAGGRNWREERPRSFAGFEEVEPLNRAQLGDGKIGLPSLKNRAIATKKTGSSAETLRRGDELGTRSPTVASPPR